MTVDAGEAGEALDLDTDLGEEVEGSEETSDDPSESFEDWMARREAEGKDKPKEKPKDKPKPEVSPEAKAEPKTEAKPEVKETETKPKPESVRLIVDGQTVDIPADKVPTMLQKALGAEKRFQEAANLRKETVEFVESLKADPVSALKKMGYDFDKLAEDYIYEKIKVSSMPDEQRELYAKAKSADEKERELEFYRRQQADEREAREKAEQEQRMEQQTAHAQKALETQIIDAIDKSGLPRNQFTVSRIAQYMRAGRLKGYDISAYDVVDKVQAELEEAAEFSRKKRVSAFKDNRKNQSQPESGAKPQRRSEKRITSIYQLLE